MMVRAVMPSVMALRSLPFPSRFSAGGAQLRGSSAMSAVRVCYGGKVFGDDQGERTGGSPSEVIKFAPVSSYGWPAHSFQ